MASPIPDHHPEDYGMSDLIYAGIGARATPHETLAHMTKIASWLARNGWHLSTGGAAGADTAFAMGAPSDCRTIHLPWRGYRGLAGPDCHVPSGDQFSACIKIAARLHPAWPRCTPAAQKLHARNVSILLGSRLDRPVDVLIAWSPEGGVTGGTGMGLRIAEMYGIHVLNLGILSPRTVCERLRSIRGRD